MISRVVLFSGGPDSFITYKYLQLMMGANPSNTVALYSNLDHRYLQEESKAVFDCAQLLGIDVTTTTVLKGLGITEDAGAFIHHRNAYLCLAASAYLQGDGVIHLTVQKDELSIPDRTQNFMDKMSFLLSGLSGKHVGVTTPWMNKDKTDMVAWFLENGGNPDDLRKTWSCYNPVGGRQCGNCPACFRRWVAFTTNNIKEDYLRNPAYSLAAAVYEEKARNNLYSPTRSARILEALSIGRTL